MALSFFPSGGGRLVDGGIKVDNVRMDAFKQAENGDGYVIRLFNAKNIPVTGLVSYKALGIDADVNLGAFEIKTYSAKDGKLTEIPMLERDFVC